MTHTALDSSGSNCRRHSQGIKAVDAAAAAVVAAVVVVKAERVAVGCNKEERVFLCPSPGSLWRDTRYKEQQQQTVVISRPGYLL